MGQWGCQELFNQFTDVFPFIILKYVFNCWTRMKACICGNTAQQAATCVHILKLILCLWQQELTSVWASCWGGEICPPRCPTWTCCRPKPRKTSQEQLWDNPARCKQRWADSLSHPFVPWCLYWTFSSTEDFFFLPLHVLNCFIADSISTWMLFFF